MRKRATCDCGTGIIAVDTEALVTAFVDHCAHSHPEWQVGEQVARNFVEALDRLTGPTERLDRIGAVEVHDATGERIEAVLAFFDHDVFADNAGWASCYCRFHHVDGSGWGERSAAENRADLAAGLESGDTRAFVAAIEGRLAGWCNASLRRAYPAHRDGSPDDDRVAAIVCFAVAPPYRGHGVARRLLEAAIERLRADGATAVEAYPTRDPASASAAYHGTVAMFGAAGFTLVSDDDHGIVMRLAFASPTLG
jgi:GNAT superfamily N-acetyltransferase